MHIDIRPVARLQGPNPVDVPAALGPLFAALGDVPADLAQLRVVCDWIQYRHNFCPPVQARPILGQPPAVELAIDLRRGLEQDLAAAVKTALAGPAAPAGTVLEPWRPASASCIWQFNALYWQALNLWEQAAGREYEQALPGGRSEARDIGPVRELILELFRVWDDLAARHALPDELYVIELGVGNGNQARTWLDVFAELDRSHGRDYYRRLHYLMGDYSPHVLDRARQTVGQHGGRVSALVLDATRPQVTLGFLAGKAFLVYISNVYDNLPTDEVASIHGRPYLVEVRAYLRDEDAAAIADRLGLPPGELAGLVGRLLRLGPELLAEATGGLLPGTSHAVALWRDTWAALRLAERYMPLDGLDAYQVTPALSGEILRPLLGSSGDIRMQVSNGALASFTGTLPLLHPFGRLICLDLFRTEPGQYHTGFGGPGKYDGSVVNWVNGALLQLAGNRRGFDVRIGPLPGRPAGPVRTLTAQVRD
jgi:hypothetical protein